MRKAAVELLLQVEMVKGVGEVCPIQVGVYAEHLAEDHLADVYELLGEARSLAEPIGLSRIRQLR